MRHSNSGFRFRAFVALSMVAAGYLFFHLLRFDLTSAVIPHWNRQPEPQPPLRGTPPKVETKEAVPEVAGSDSAAIVKPRPGDFYRYTDDSGTIHLLDDPAKIPDRYKAQVKCIAGGNTRTTRIICKDNHVLVPVTLTYKGRETQTMLALDTGASITTISNAVAGRLGVQQPDVVVASATVADGRRVSEYRFAADSIAVDDHRISASAVSILPGCGGNGAEGLLGMNFLKEFRYRIDYSRGVIEWSND